MAMYRLSQVIPTCILLGLSIYIHSKQSVAMSKYPGIPECRHVQVSRDSYVSRPSWDTFGIVHHRNTQYKQSVVLPPIQVSQDSHVSRPSQDTLGIVLISLSGRWPTFTTPLDAATDIMEFIMKDKTSFPKLKTSCNSSTTSCMSL